MKSFFKELIWTATISVCIALLMLKFLLFPICVQGSSMYPTLQNGEMGVSFIITRNIGVDRFDIVIIEPKAGTDRLVKRVIGLPNERISYQDNKLYVNDVYVEEYFLNDTFTADFEVVLAENEYFCMGDNRLYSSDSRYYGPFLKEEIIATHAFIYYPFGEFGFNN